MRAPYAVVGFFILTFTFASCGSDDLTREMSASERFQIAMNEYNDEDYLDALQQFDVIRLQYPGSIVSDSARYFAGMSRFKREEFLLASYEFNQVRMGAPTSGLLADGQYMYALSYTMLSPEVPLDQTYTLRAIDAMQSFIEMYPRHPKVTEAEEHITTMYNKLAEKEYDTGVLYVKMEDPDAALIYFNSVIDKYYSTTFADDAMYRKIEILVRKKEKTEAEKTIQLFLEKYPESPYRDDVIALRESSALTSKD